MRFRSWLPVFVAYLCICGITATKDPDQDEGNGNGIRWKNPIVDGKGVGITSGSTSTPIKNPPKRNEAQRKNSKDKKGKQELIVSNCDTAKARTTDAQRKSSLQCTAENSLPLPNI